MERSGITDVRTYCFGECQFIPDRQLLLHREVPIRIGSRALDLLHALVQRPGDIISKDELIRFAWPNIFVHEDNLKVNIASLRRALPHRQTELPYIATVPGRGYRFVAPLRIFGPLDAAALPDAVKGITGKLPVVSALIGREEVMTDITDTLAQTRLLTIVGPAGVGKTSMAIVTARHVGEEFKDGVCFVDLAAIEDPQLVVPAIAFALGLEGNLVHVLGGLVEVLRDREMLLVLDNCEHVLSAVASVVDHLYHALPALLVIATSREPLRCRMESVCRLAPLRCPSDKDVLDGEMAMTFPAIELLVRRAEAHGYQLKNEDAPSLAAISRRLDGIALAIELAAPRLAEKGAPTLLGLLQHSFEPLASEADATPSRHMTLTATLDWSYRLLPGNEARLLRYLSVFSGTFALDDVFGAFGHLAKAEDTLAWLESLAARSLLSVIYHSGRRRYRLLDITKSFAAERLLEYDNQKTAMALYARYLLTLFEQAEAEWNWRTREDWTATYGHWGNDLRRAIDWALGAEEDIELGIRLTVSGIPLWHEFSSVGEIRLRVRTALDAAVGLSPCDRTLEMKLLAAYAINLCLSRKQKVAEDILQKGIRLADELGNVEYRIRMSANLCGVQCFSGRGREALTTLSDLRKVINPAGLNSALPDIRWHELMVHSCCGDLRRSYKGLSQLASEHATVTNRSQISRFAIDRFVAIRTFLALPAWAIGRPQRAFDVANHAVEAAATLDHHLSHSYALSLAAIPVSLLSGFHDVAQKHVSTLCDVLALHENQTWPAFSRFYQSTLDTASGDPGGLAKMRVAIDEMVEGNYLIHVPMHLAMLADAALLHDHLDLARAVIVEAEKYANQTGERWCRAELLRLQSIVHWREGKLSRADDVLKKAMKVAECDRALSFELRAAISHAQLAQLTGSSDLALAQLKAVYRRFDFSFHSADLLAARALLHGF